MTKEDEALHVVPGFCRKSKGYFINQHCDVMQMTLPELLQISGNYL